VHTLSISCASCILCSLGSLPSSLLYGARYLWQRVNGERCWSEPCPSTWEFSQLQGWWDCCEAFTCPQGKREACHVLLLRWMLSCCFERAVSSYLACLAFYFECFLSYGDAGALLWTSKVNFLSCEFVVPIYNIVNWFWKYCTLKIGLYWSYLDLVCSGIIWTCLCLQILPVWYGLVTAGLTSKYCSMG